MKTSIVIGAGALATAAALLSAGTASAGGPPDVTGQKYSDAQSALSGAGFTAVVATTVGDRSSWSDCIVTNAHEHDAQPPENSGGSATKNVLVSLNCDAAVAAPGVAGNSAASVPGRAAIESAKEAAASSSSAAAAAAATPAS